ncbi:MAG: ATP-binding protein [Oscillospiraceae bacterium]|nr:ATP-binding protein [Oscillospiraceae bacterium]
MSKRIENLKNRSLYLNRLIGFQDTELVKVITGIRRCGKSSLMKLMIQHLKENGIQENQFVVMNFESIQYRGMSSKDVYNYVAERVIPDKKMYIFLDEIQRIPEWQDAVNSFRVDFDTDIYLTGSNAYLLSSEISTYLAGRFVEIKMLPLSFREFLDFNDYSVTEYNSPAGILKRRVTDKAGQIYEMDDLLEAYLMFGGMPGLSEVGLEQDKVFAVLEGIYSTIVVRDILEREYRRGQKRITDADLLKKIIMFLADNIGNNVSLTSITNTLMNERLIEDSPKKGKPAVQTIQAYVSALLESYVFYEIRRFDIKGKEYLRTLGKYYISDLGLKNYLLGYRGADTGHAIENLVYFELKRRGYDVAVGKTGNREIDFIATKTREKKYIQVTERMEEESTKESELSPLRSIRDNHEKIVIQRYGPSGETEDGIKIINLCDYLLS